MICPAVYILANKPNGTLYIGVTSKLPTRIWQHKNNLANGFCKRYQIHDLVYFEQFSDMYNAICRERQLKHWTRAWKTQLIEASNPQWIDLYESIL